MKTEVADTGRKALLFIIGLLFLIPFVLLINIAFRPESNTGSYWIPSFAFNLENFINSWVKADLGNAFLNTVIITISVVSSVIVLGASAAYPLARVQSKVNRMVYYLIVACLIVPPLTILVPLYILVVKTIGTSNFLSIILPLTAYELPLTVFLYSTFMVSVPRELDEAALLDGCSKLQTFTHVIFPLLKPVTATVIIMVGVHVWNDFAFSVFFLQRPSLYNFTVALGQFFSQYSNRIHWVAAGCLLGLMPISILYLFMQKYFIQGLSSGAVKG